MFARVHVIGRGRVGGAAAARLADRGVTLTDQNPDLVLLCVPDRAIAAVASTQPLGPWVAHVSGATPLLVLAPHVRRFGLHPLQTFTRAGGAVQFDGAWGAVTGESDEARRAGHALATQLGLRPFLLDDEQRVLYHAGAAVASNFLVTLYRTAARLFHEAGAPPEALVPLMHRTIVNGFDLTGPIARGDWPVVDAHVAALADRTPDLVPLYQALAAATRR